MFPNRSRAARRIRGGLLLLLAIPLAASGCARVNPKQQAFETAKQQGAYQLIAATKIGDDQVEIWKAASQSGDAAFGPFLMAAIGPSGECLDFCHGDFRSSTRPFFQSARYVALVASTGLEHERDVFFIYDAQSHCFSKHPVDKFVPHVHENIVVVGAAVFFAACKSPKPVGRLDLTTGEVTTFGSPAPQSGNFYVSGADVLVRGTDQKTYRIDATNLTRVDDPLPSGPPTQMGFDALLIRPE
jgi:hypothetical protein